MLGTIHCIYPIKINEVNEYYLPTRRRGYNRPRRRSLFRNEIFALTSVRFLQSCYVEANALNIRPIHSNAIIRCVARISVRSEAPSNVSYYCMLRRGWVENAALNRSLWEALYKLSKRMNNLPCNAFKRNFIPLPTNEVIEERFQPPNLRWTIMEECWTCSWSIPNPMKFNAVTQNCSTTVTPEDDRSQKRRRVRGSGRRGGYACTRCAMRTCGNWRRSHQRHPNAGPGAPSLWGRRQRRRAEGRLKVYIRADVPAKFAVVCQNGKIEQKNTWRGRETVVGRTRSAVPDAVAAGSGPPGRSTEGRQWAGPDVPRYDRRLEGRGPAGVGEVTSGVRWTSGAAGRKDSIRKGKRERWRIRYVDVDTFKDH